MTPRPEVDSAYWTYVERSRLSRLLKVGARREYEALIDFGCGRGEFLRGFCRSVNVRSVQGVDGSDDAVSLARGRGIAAFVANLNRDRVPFESESADVILMIETIEHLENVEHCLDEVRRVLKPGGDLFVTTPNLASWHGRVSLALGFQPLSLDVGFRKHYGSIVTLSGRSAGHIRGFTKPALADMLESNGFRAEAWSGSPAVATGNSRALTLLRLVDRVLSAFPSLASELVVHATRQLETTSEERIP